MYPDFQTFCKYHNTDMQLDAVKHPRAYLTGMDYTLKEIEMIYNERASAWWLNMHISHIMDANKASDEVKQLVDKLGVKLGAVFYSNTCKEIILFFGELDCGKLGKIYGNINAQDIMEAASIFIKGLYKRKQSANEEMRRENGSLNIQPVSVDLSETGRGDKGLSVYLASAPSDSYLAYCSQKYGWGYMVPESCKAMFHDIDNRVKNLFKPYYLKV